jgi:hypothetical protein
MAATSLHMGYQTLGLNNGTLKNFLISYKFASSQQHFHHIQYPLDLI